MHCKESLTISERANSEIFSPDIGFKDVGIPCGIPPLKPHHLGKWSAVKLRTINSGVPSFFLVRTPEV